MRRTSRKSGRRGNRAEVGVEPEEVEEDGQLEGRERKKKNVQCTGRGKNEYYDYALPHVESEASVALYDSEPAIPFEFGPRYAGFPPRSRE